MSDNKQNDQKINKAEQHREHGEKVRDRLEQELKKHGL